jgi:hypothetical protein
MRHYWEAIFSIEYFPYWEFTMLMMLVMQLSMIWRLSKIEHKININNETMNDVLDELID